MQCIFLLLNSLQRLASEGQEGTNIKEKIEGTQENLSYRGKYKKKYIYMWSVNLFCIEQHSTIWNQVHRNYEAIFQSCHLWVTWVGPLTALIIG